MRVLPGGSMTKTSNYVRSMVGLGLALAVANPSLAQNATSGTQAVSEKPPLSQDRQHQIDEALADEKIGNDAGALAIWKSLADADIPLGEMHLGLFFLQGRGGLCPDGAEGAQWVTKAAIEGLAEAQRQAGYLYLTGTGVMRDADAAKGWFLKAANQGDAESEEMLGDIYSAGTPSSEDYANAVLWYTKAAAQGRSAVALQLGFFYKFGRGVPQDHAKAAEWFHVAAENGNGLAQYQLGHMYEDGRGVPRDYVEAYKWYALAASSSTFASADAGTLRDAARARLTPAQIQKAEKEIRTARADMPDVPIPVPPVPTAPKAACLAQAQSTAPSGPPSPQPNQSNVQQEIATAKDLEAQGRFSESIPVWTHLADHGSPEAQVHLAMAEYYGTNGRCRDHTWVIERLTAAANQGYAEAYRDLGMIYDSDPDLRDPANAVLWYQKGADANDAPSQDGLFTIFWNGRGVPRDPAKAVYWLEKAASHPNKRAIFDAFALGNIYADGKDIPNDDEKAEHWYLVGATGGLTNAQFAVAGLYEKRHDYGEAYRWYALVAASSARANFKDVAAARDRMAAQLTPAQLAEADKRVAETKFPSIEIPPPSSIPLTTGCRTLPQKP